MRLAFVALIWLGAAALVAATALAESGIVTWWALMWEFPRVHILIASLALALAALGARAFALALALSLVAAVHLWRLHPYTPFVPYEVPLTLREIAGPSVSLVSLNVKMDLEERSEIVAYLGRASPDVLLLMEVDEGWMADLAPVLDGYETVLAEPKGNFYGMVLATRLPASEARMAYLEDDTPTAIAELTAPGGARFTLLGLHPRPPVPGQGMSDHRSQLLRAGEIASASDLPVVAMGDLNAPSWSEASHEFKEDGGYLDLRIGRGILPTFRTGSRLMLFPIDQIYVTGGVELLAFGRGPDVGSDHWPVEAVISP